MKSRIVGLLVVGGVLAVTAGCAESNTSGYNLEATKVITTSQAAPKSCHFIDYVSDHDEGRLKVLGRTHHSIDAKELATLRDEAEKIGANLVVVVEHEEFPDKNSAREFEHELLGKAYQCDPRAIANMSHHIEPLTILASDSHGGSGGFHGGGTGGHR